MNRVVQRNMIVPNMHLLEIEAPQIASKIGRVSSSSSVPMKRVSAYRFPWLTGTRRRAR